MISTVSDGDADDWYTSETKVRHAQPRQTTVEWLVDKGWTVRTRKAFYTKRITFKKQECEVHIHLPLQEKDRVEQVTEDSAMFVWQEADRGTHITMEAIGRGSTYNPRIWWTGTRWNKSLKACYPEGGEDWLLSNRHDLCSEAGLL